MKAFIIGTVSSLSLLGIAALPAYAGTTNATASFTAPQSISQSKLAYLQSNYVTQKPTSPSKLEVSPATSITGGGSGQSASFSYSGIWPNSYINSTARYIISSPETVYVQLAQTFGGIGGGTPVADYELIPASTGVQTAPIQVSGTFLTTDEDTIEFYNVQPGTYYLQIDNLSSYDLNGSGTVYY